MPKFKGDMIQLIKMRHSNIQAMTPKEKRKKKKKRGWPSESTHHAPPVSWPRPVGSNRRKTGKLMITKSISFRHSQPAKKYETVCIYFQVPTSTSSIAWQRQIMLLYLSSLIVSYSFQQLHKMHFSRTSITKGNQEPHKMHFSRTVNEKQSSKTVNYSQGRGTFTSPSKKNLSSLHNPN